MVNKIINFQGFRFLPSVSDDSVICFYDDSPNIELPSYVRYKGNYYRYSKMFLDSEKCTLLVTYNVCSATLEQIVKLFKDSDTFGIIEILN